MTQTLSQDAPGDATPFDEEVFVMPTSFAQQRLWFLDQFEPNSPFYNIPTAVRLRGALDVDALERALGEIVRRHEVLRTTFAMVEGKPVQVISPEMQLTMPVEDLSALPADEREAEALKRATAEARRPFNLARGPLLRARLLRLAADEHIILLTMHHIVSDGWSMGVLVGEIGALYDAFSHGRPSPLPELALQYADYAHWQRQWLVGDVLDQQIDYWKKALGPEPPVLELPTDRPRPAVQTSRGASVERVISKDLLDDLRAVGRSEGATIFMTLMAAYDVLLARTSGQTDISVGTPIANRTRAEIEPLIGMFINTLVIRSDVSGDPTFRELLRRVKESALGAYAHQDVPFEMLVEVLQPERDMSRSPLFQVMFILQNAPVKRQELPGLTLEQLDVDAGVATADLTFNASEGPGGLLISAEYNTDLFDESTIQRMLGHYEMLLACIAADADTAISALPMLTEAERQQAIYEWNDTTADFDTTRCLHELFEAQASKMPDTPAVVLPAFGGQPRRTLTYNTLNSRANQLAHLLREKGVGPETIVAIAAERSPEMIVALLGVLKAGGAYLPIDPTYPADRIDHMLSDSGAKLLLTQAHLVESLPEHDAETIRLDADWESMVGQRPADNVSTDVKPENLAYVIYTSGSTGQSKGVMIEHRSIVNAYYAWERDYDLHGKARVHLQMASFSFDVFTGDLTRALGSGGTLVMTPREWLLDPERLYGLMREEGVNAGEFVPAVLRGLVQYLDETGQRLDFMRLLICGSDSWYVDEYRRFLRFCGPETRLINSFGLTEATIDSCYFEGPLDGLFADRSVPIGRPYANQQLYVLDAHQQPVPIRSAGELYVGGAALARGYLNRPEMTAERFVPNPFDGAPGARLYRTGDMAARLPDGNVEFLGRMDYQVKIRGYRIEPGEIEAALAQHPAVEQAAVTPKDAPTGDRRLVAYAVLAEGSEAATTDLRRYLQDRLPDYMVPSSFVLLDELPLTPNDKVDRNALPEPDWTLREVAEEFIAPRTDAERVLANVWTQVLGVEKVGVQDNFFELGGHSLLATQLVSRVRESFGVEMPLRSVFEAPTVEAQAGQIELLRRTAGRRQAPPIRPAAREGAIPLSFAQQRLWFLDQLEPNSPFYNIPEAVRLTGELDVAVLERALNEVVRRHEVLRTTFRTEDGQPQQVIAPELHVPLPLLDLSDMPKSEREAEALRQAEREAQRPFDLARGPLLRARLVRLAADEHIILLTIHHIIGDDWSTNVIIQEMAVLVDAYQKAQPSPLPDLPVQYADFAIWQRNWLRGEVLDEQLGYWKDQLGGAPPLLELPTDRPRPSVQTYAGSYRQFTLSPELTQVLNELTQREGATPFMTLLAAFQLLLARHSGQDDISVGTPIAGRGRAEVENLIGFFINTLVLRTQIAEDGTFRDLLAQVRETALGAYAHQDVPFEMLVDALQPEREMSHTPLFQAMFALQNTPMRAQQLPGMVLTPVEAHSGTAKFDLTLFMAEGETLAGAFEYNTDLFDPSTIDRMIGHFTRLLEGIAANPDAPVSTLPLLTEAERQQILVEWNDTAAPVPTDLCGHELFEAQVAKMPDAPAAAYNGQTLTYAELDARANQLAHALRDRGVGPESLVGIAAGRSLDVVVGLLGVLKAGGAYLPIDVSYPPDRVAFMLEDSGVNVLLTQAHLLDGLPDHNAETICLDEDWPEISQQPTSRPESGVRPENLAYVIYTSGSTGKPKGAMIEHRGLVNYLAWCNRAYPLAEGSGSPVHSSISFDLTITGLFAPLTAGGCVTLLPEGGEVEALADALAQSDGFSLVKITPAHLELISHQLTPEQAAGRTHAFIIGGEALREEQIAFWRAHAPDTALFNEYGPTETVVGCCVYEVPPGPVRSGPNGVPIGTPIINTSLYILDAQKQPVPVGVAGELYIGGRGVGRGYLNRPELTAERFLPDPFSDAPDARMYKTGDLCRWLPDGNIEFLGRTDHQVKVRGFRIELGEIEEALTKLPAVKDAVVLAREDEPGYKRLVAYVVARGETPPTVGELRAALGETLPEYMVPAVFVFLDALPLTVNGKVDRKALPEPSDERPDLENEYTAPQTEAEEVLVGIFSGVLGVERIGIHDNFFELGGDSILSIQIVSRANQAGLRLSPRQVFEHPTVSGLAGVAGRGPAVQAEQGAVTGDVPLTPIQRWFFEQEIDERHHWNQSVMFEVMEPLSRGALGQAVDSLLAHHDALRLRFTQGAAGWEAANVAPGESSAFRVIDVSGLPPGEQRAKVEAEAAAAQASLDIESGPLLRVTYFDRGDGGWLLFVAHHLVVDGVSWRVLLEDFQTVYGLIEAGQPVALPLKTTSFKAWAQKLETYAQSGELREELEYWQAVAGESAPLPQDTPGGTNRERDAASLSVELTAAETDALLRDVPAAFRTEINEALLTALASAIGEWTGEASALIALEGHGREDLFDDVDISRTVGWFTSLYPVRLDVSSADDTAEQLKAVKEQIRSIPKRGIGYGLLRTLSDDGAVRGLLASLPQPEIAFNYLGQFDQMAQSAAGGPLRASDVPQGAERSPDAPRTHLLEVNGGVMGGKLNMEWTYSEALHQQATIQRVADSFLAALRAIIEQAQAAETIHVTASDVADVGWGADELEDILTELEDDLEDLFGDLDEF